MPVLLRYTLLMLAVFAGPFVLMYLYARLIMWIFSVRDYLVDWIDKDKEV